MANPATTKMYYTPEEYFELEEHSEYRHEFHHGELFRMDGTTIRHNEIIDNIKEVLRIIFRPKGCKVVSEAVRLEALKNEYYPYPDIMLSCHGFDRESETTIRNPSLIVEILSKSTEHIDRGFKWKYYKTIPTLQHYLLVSQYECLLELYSRTEKPDVWLYQSYGKMTDVVHFMHLDFELSVGKVYENISFPPPEEETAEIAN